MILILFVLPLVAALVALVRNPRGRAAGVWIGVFMLFPAACLALGLGAADAFGCTVSEAGTRPCPVAGVDLGTLLGGLVVGGGWIMLVTLPVGAVLLLVWALVRYVAIRRAR